MKPRDRMISALNHQEPDRIPLAIGGGPYGMVDALYLKLVELYKLGRPVQPFRSGHSISFMDDRLLKELGTDTRYCWPGLLPNSPINMGADNNTFYDSYGQVWKKALPYYYADKGILEDSDDIEDIERLVKWPNLSDPRWVSGLSERSMQLRLETDYYVIMRMVASHGPFQTACDFRGTENFLMDMTLNPEFAHALLDKITTSLEGLLKLTLQAGGKYFDMIELPGDDYGGNTNTIISPRMFRNFILPCLKRLVSSIKEYNPNIKVMLHSDGAITSLIPDIISIGVDVIHPLEPLLATDIPSVKNNFGGKISFLGGIDISHALIGNEQDVITEVQTRIHQLAHGGGYVIAPSNHLQSDVPPENVKTLVESARIFGQYPINNPNIRKDLSG